MTHPSPKRNMVPKAVLMRSGLVSLTTARPVNTAQPRTTVNSARPMTNLIKHIQLQKAVVNTAKPKAVLNVVKGNQVNAVKASACWVWKPKTNGNPQQDLQEKGVIDSGCSRHMTGNMSYLTNFKEINGGYVAFGGNSKGWKITGRVPRKNNMYSVDLKNIVPKRGLTCLFAKATSDESNLWHRRLEHINFKTMNKLVKGNLVRGLPSKLFENNQTCVACQKGKQHEPLVKSKTVRLDFLLATKDETSGILKSFITGVENLINQKVKVIRCDNGTEFKNKEMNQFCERKDHLGKFNGKADEGFFVGYSIKSKAFKVKLEWRHSKSSPDAGFKPSRDNEKKVTKELGKEGGDPSKEGESNDQEKEDNVNNTNTINFASINDVNDVGRKSSIELPDDPNMLALEDYSIFDLSSDDQDVGAEADMNNLDAFMPISPIPTTRVHKDHPVEQIIRDLNYAP
ncbi:putative ribonuclease H-like domain-containing protein [Tanacetum coccineum]